MSEKRDYYDVLGLQKGCSEDDIKKAYRRIAKECHPDLHPGDKECEARFKEVNEAAQVLGDPDKRAKYDQFGHAAFDPSQGFGGFDPSGFGGFGGFGDIFGNLGDLFGFGGGTQRGPRRGESIHAGVTVDFEEAAFGCSKNISISRIEQCPDCHGSGCAPGTTPEICPECKGSGSVRTTQRTPFGMMQSTGPCPRCGGTGKIIHQPCQKCRGKGNIRRNTSVSITIPAGIDNGQTVSIRGKGHAGQDGAPAGDLLVTVTVRRHSEFEREGTSVISTVPISFAQAALGAEVEVRTLDGRIKLNIPEGTQPGAVFRLRGKGIPYLRGSGRGDHFVTVTIAVPKNLTTAQREALRAFSASMNENSRESSGIFGHKRK